MPTEILSAVLVVAAACAGVVVYALLSNGEKPEPVETDVEHDSAGNKLAKSDPRYWLTVLVEGLFSYPAALIRKLFGLPQK